MANHPDALAEEEQQQKRGEALRPSDVDVGKGHAAESGPLVLAIFKLAEFVCMHSDEGTIRVYRVEARRYRERARDAR